MLLAPPSSYRHTKEKDYCREWTQTARSAYSAAGKYEDRSWEYINLSQAHECGNWDWGHAIPRKGIHKWDFRCSTADTLQIQNTEISKQILPEKEYRGLSPSFHIHASVSYLYIPTIGLPILLEEICRPLLGLYKSLTYT
jgi:hypothetical protein